MAITFQELEHLEMVQAAATPGAWYWLPEHVALVVDCPRPEPYNTKQYVLYPANVVGNPQNVREALGACGLDTEADAEHNAKFMETFHPGKVGLMLAEIRRLRERVQQLEQGI